MGLDLHAAVKIVDGKKIRSVDTINNEFPDIPARYDDDEAYEYYCHDSIRGLVIDLNNSGEDVLEGLADRLYGDREGGREYYPDDSVKDMPDDLPNSMLPRVITVEEAFELANDIEELKGRFDDVTRTVEYLRFWASRDHCIMCSY